MCVREKAQSSSQTAILTLWNKTFYEAEIKWAYKKIQT